MIRVQKRPILGQNFPGVPFLYNYNRKSSGNTRISSYIDYTFVVVDGGFTPWTEYGKCSANCGDGYMVRTRTCTNPAPSNGGSNCVGARLERTPCKIKECPGNITHRDAMGLVKQNSSSKA